MEYEIKEEKPIGRKKTRKKNQLDPKRRGRKQLRKEAEGKFERIGLGSRRSQSAQTQVNPNQFKNNIHSAYVQIQRGYTMKRSLCVSLSIKGAFSVSSPIKSSLRLDALGAEAEDDALPMGGNSSYSFQCRMGSDFDRANEASGCPYAKYLIIRRAEFYTRSINGSDTQQ